MPEKSDKTFFGFQEVPKDLKQKLVNNVFTSVASKYDLMNDVMSFGIHRIWKKLLLNQIYPNADLTILDMAAGTGDIAFNINKKFANYGYKAEITLADISDEMLQIAKDRAIDNNQFANLKFVQTAAETLEFADDIFDYYVVAYGIRNFSDRAKALKEAHRVLKKGGKFLCLEFSQIPNEFLAKAYDFYSFNFIPKFGQLITGDQGSYEYFVESIRKFPMPEAFCQEITEAGFKEVRSQSYSLGITNLYIAHK